MKFLMNGCLLLATADGSTIEMVEEIGQDNMFLFGAKAHEVVALRKKGPTLKVPLQFSRVVRMIRDGHFGFEDYFKSLCDKIEGTSDYFLLGADFMSYLEAQAAADKAFVDEERWTKMSILSAAGSGRFSSDRTIQEIQNLNAKTLSLKEYGKSLEDMANKSTYLQSALFDL
ncbi:hypothetical protein Gohar_023587, partial [Gossypium harknessii]|nr:hypothetical protein [Gossypium harknessii]